MLGYDSDTANMAAVAASQQLCMPIYKMLGEKLEH